MRAGAYCNAAGTICTTSDKLGGGGGDTITIKGRCFQPAAAVSCFWNWSGDGNDTAMFITYNLTSPQSACQGNHNNFQSYKIILAQCESVAIFWNKSAWAKVGSTNNYTRTVTCQDTKGITLPDTSCPPPKPVTTCTAPASFFGYINTSSSASCPV